MLERRERLAARRLVALVGDEEPRVAVLEDVRDRRGVEARVHAAERRARHRDALLGLDHLGRVVEHALDDVAAAAALLAEGVAELRAAVVELRPRPRAVAVDDRRAVGEDVPAFRSTLRHRRGDNVPGQAAREAPPAPSDQAEDMQDAGNVPRAVDERQRRERDEVRAGALREGVDGEASNSEAVHF